MMPQELHRGAQSSEGPGFEAEAPKMGSFRENDDWLGLLVRGYGAITFHGAECNTVQIGASTAPFGHGSDRGASAKVDSIGARRVPVQPLARRHGEGGEGRW